MKRSLRVSFALVLATVATAAQAHFLWATYVPASKTFAIQFAESPGDSVIPELAGKKDVILPTVAKAGNPEALPMTFNSDDDQLVAPAVGEAFGATLHYGLITREGTPFFLEYYAKAAASVKASQDRQGLVLELSVLERTGSSVKLSLSYRGKPAANADVVAYVNNAEDSVEVKTGADGTVTVTVPEGQPIVVRAVVPETKSGTVDGKSYDLVKHYTTLTIP